MATATATAIQKLKESPEVERAKVMEKRIEDKLNFDGKWGAHPMIDMARMGSLTNLESDFLGRKMGWTEEFYAGVDWDKVETVFLAECMLLPEKRTMNTLSYVHPAPDRIPVFDMAEKSNSGDIEAFLAGDLSFDELAKRHPIKEGK